MFPPRLVAAVGVAAGLVDECTAHRGGGGGAVRDVLDIDGACGRMLGCMTPWEKVAELVALNR